MSSESANSHSIAMSALQQYVAPASDLGIDTTTLLAQYGLSLQQVNDNHARIERALFSQVLDALIRASGDPLFGFKTGQRIHVATFNILGYITLNCHTLGEALAQVPQYEQLSGGHGSTSVITDDEWLTVCWNCGLDTEHLRRHAVENVLVSWTQFTRWIMNVDGPIERVLFEHPAPAGGDNLAMYEAFFDCPVLFEQTMSAIVLPINTLALPVKRADASVRQSLLAVAQQRLNELRANGDVIERVKYEITTLLKCASAPSKHEVAQTMGISGRTLQRRLDASGVSYQALLQCVREQKALQLLTQTRLSIEEIGHRLGFKEPRSFYRSFKQWTGRTPNQARNAHADQLLNQAMQQQAPTHTPAAVSVSAYREAKTHMLKTEQRP